MHLCDEDDQMVSLMRMVYFSLTHESIINQVRLIGGTHLNNRCFGHPSLRMWTCSLLLSWNSPVSQSHQDGKRGKGTHGASVTTLNSPSGRCSVTSRIHHTLGISLTGYLCANRRVCCFTGNPFFLAVNGSSHSVSKALAQPCSLSSPFSFLRKLVPTLQPGGFFFFSWV